MEFQVPQPLKVEHDELHARLAEATAVPGRIGDAARAVAKLWHPHFIKEEAYALPPLSLLPRLAAGQVTAEMRDVLPMTEQLAGELPQMLEEHKAVVAALAQLVDSARQEQQPEYAHFAEQLKVHAQLEEQVLYPTAMLIGRYLELLLKR